MDDLGRQASGTLAGIQINGNQYPVTVGAGLTLTNGTLAASGGGGSTLAIGSAVTGGTAGSVLYVDASGNLGQDNANFHFDITNKAFGIGTNNPTALGNLVVALPGTVVQVIKSTDTAPSVYRSISQYIDGNGEGWECGYNADKGSRKFGIYQIVSGTTTEVFSIDFSSWLVSAGLSLKVGGGLSTAYAAKTAAYTLGANDSIVTADATAAAFAITLPAANSVASGRSYTIKKTDASANAVTLTAAGTDTIDGAATYALSAQWAAATVVSDGASHWFITGKI